MREYLEAIMKEQISRALFLKGKIPHPNKFAELSGLSDKCEYILDEQIQFLEALKDELRNRDESDINDIIRGTRSAIRQISSIEYYGISTLYYQTEDLGLLNKISFSIYQEINLPFGHPCVSCTATQYYSSVPDVNVIFVPLGESDFLLHLPDIYHEIGHCVVKNLETVPKLSPLLDAYRETVSHVALEYTKLLRQKRREYTPEEIPIQIERICSQWKYWIEEFFCDLVALYTLGPAYAWSHIHLTMKTSEDIFRLDTLFGTSHPADAARMSLLFMGLNLLGYDRVVDEMKNKWEEIAQYCPQPAPEYQYAYPEQLLTDIAKLIYNGVTNSGFRLAHNSGTGSKSSSRIGSLLNTAWSKFWTDTPENFRKWEQESVENLRTSLQVKASHPAAS
jgi:hypothetical protein